MKILIISLPRTGSTSLMKKYALEYNLETIYQPFSNDNIEKYKNFDFTKNDDFVLKSIIDQIPENESDYIKFWKNFYKLFDKTILLSRKSLIQCAESLAYMSYFNDKTWHRKYEWEETPNLKKIIPYIVTLDNNMSKLKKLINEKITFYEDIFDETSDDRYRININKKRLI
jgi:hypothetical protein